MNRYVFPSTNRSLCALYRLEWDEPRSPIELLRRRQGRARSYGSLVPSLGIFSTFCRSRTTARFSTHFPSLQLENAYAAETFTRP